jgi:hypothetical protein
MAMMNSLITKDPSSRSISSRSSHFHVCRLCRDVNVNTKFDVSGPTVNVVTATMLHLSIVQPPAPSLVSSKF